MNYPELAPASNEGLCKPIPTELASVEGWKKVSIYDDGEPLVPLGAFSPNDDIFTSSIYYGEHSNSPYSEPSLQLRGSLITPFVREGVAHRLRYAQQLLPENHFLVVLDAYRNLDVQQALYDHYYGQLLIKHPGWDENTLSSETQKYVSLPSGDKTKPSPHNTGGSVDLAIYKLPNHVAETLRDIESTIHDLQAVAPQKFTEEDEARNPVLQRLYMLQMQRLGLIRSNAVWLNFGTAFDHGGKEASTNYYEVIGEQRALSDFEREAQLSRRLLYNVMVRSGMQAYEDEWWHFNAPESQMGAKTAGNVYAKYGAALLSGENFGHEYVRTSHHAGVTAIHNYIRSSQQTRKVSLFSRLMQLNMDAVRDSGDPHLVTLPRAAVIAP